MPNIPRGRQPPLKKERLTCGIDDPGLDTVIAGSRMSRRLCRVPEAARILSRIVADLHLMATPVLAKKPTDLRARLESLLAALPAAKDDLLDGDAVSAMMQAGHDHPDSLHRLVMDLHKRLNAMQAELAEETLDGAAVYGLADPDRPRVSAFMAGPGWLSRMTLAPPTHT
jgi:hypothetical protein